MKKLLSVLLAISACLAFASCNAADDNEEIERLKKKIEKLESQLEAYENGEADVTEKPSATLRPDKDGFFEVPFNQKVSLEFVEFTIEDSLCTEELTPADTSGVYSYMADNEDEKYFCIYGTLKNLSGEEYDIEDIVSEICFNDKYTYTAHLKADDGDGDFYGNYVKPLGSVTFYIYASVPDEVVNIYESCTVKFGFKEGFSGSYYDDFEECDYLYYVTFNK